jgi:hypothetical protein
VIFDGRPKCPIMNNKSRGRLATFVLPSLQRGLPGHL